MVRIKDGKPGPVEVWLTQQGRTGIACKAIGEDGTVTEYEIDAPSMRGAQREITHWLIKLKGYTPLGRWETRAGDDGQPIESMRRFRTA